MVPGSNPGGGTNIFIIHPFAIIIL
jgi:hypothetical protein